MDSKSPDIGCLSQPMHLKRIPNHVPNISDVRAKDGEGATMGKLRMCLKCTSDSCLIISHQNVSGCRHTHHEMPIRSPLKRVLQCSADHQQSQTITLTLMSERLTNALTPILHHVQMVTNASRSSPKTLPLRALGLPPRSWMASAREAEAWRSLHQYRSPRPSPPNLR